MHYPALLTAIKLQLQMVCDVEVRRQKKTNRGDRQMRICKGCILMHHHTEWSIMTTKEIHKATQLKLGRQKLGQFTKKTIITIMMMMAWHTQLSTQTFKCICCVNYTVYH